MKIYLDNCCFNRPYDDQQSLSIRIETEVKLEIQNQIYLGVIELVWSYILDYENMQNPHLERRKEISNWRNIAIVNVFENPFILKKTLEIENKGLRL